jgi:peptide/nickel transport system permease protein
VRDEIPVSAATATASLRLPRLGGAGWAGTAIVGFFGVVALAGPSLTPYRTTQLAGRPLEAPSALHLLGTNSVGQDLASQMVAGARVSLVIAVLAGGGTVLVGSLVGVLAGWLGGRTDAVLMRVVDLVLVTPRLPLLIVVGAYVGPSLPVIALIIALTFWPISARVVRSQVLSLRQRAHIRAAVGFGSGTVTILRRHIVPEVSLILVAGLVSSAGRAIMVEAGLAFLGLGDPTRASWGKVMRDAMDFSGLFFTDAWSWWLLPPVLAITLLLVGVTFLGVSVERRINPRLARHLGGRP